MFISHWGWFDLDELMVDRHEYATPWGFLTL